MASLDFYRDLVAFAKKHGLFILSDLAYAEVYFDNDPPPSVLQVPGAMDVAVEFTSMSKTFSMPGWRMGFAVGNERIIAALARVKSYLDYGAFTPIQAAGDRGPQRPGRLHRARCARPTRSGATRWWTVSAAPAGAFPRPPPRCSPGRRCRRCSSPSAASNSRNCWWRRPSVAVSPGIAFGEHGEGFVRIALVENEQRIRQAARNVRRFLESAPEKLHNVVPLATRR